VKPLAITLGDPAGIGPEIVQKALDGTSIPYRLFGETHGPIRYGEISGEYGRVALDAIDEALDAIERGECSALVTAPIHKQAIALAGSQFPGHTELLAARAGREHYGRDYAMYFDSPRLKTVLLSVHVPLVDAIRSIDASSILALTQLMSREYARLYGTPPRIAVAGLNPHAGEGGRFGREDEIIALAVERSRALGLSVTGPHPPDTVFLSAINGKCDVVLAMYHDQGLIPVKTTAFHESVNVTIGLPFLRVSVDHGTAFDIAGKGIADAGPMRYAIEWAARHAESFAR
jgi:4-hydroxythreonine-4-phosphate dehydrogenase